MNGVQGSDTIRADHLSLHNEQQERNRLILFATGHYEQDRTVRKIYQNRKARAEEERILR